MKIELEGTELELDTMIDIIKEQVAPNIVKLNSRRPISEVSGYFRQSLRFSFEETEEKQPVSAKTGPKTGDVPDKAPINRVGENIKLTRAERDHDRAIDWARRVVELNPVYYDLETTGKDPKTARIVQIGMVNRDGKVLMDTLVNPGAAISAGATGVHGITNEMVKDAPTFNELAKTIQFIFTKYNPVAYNAAYDGTIILHEFKRMNELFAVPIYRPHYCAMEHFAMLYGEWKEYFQSYTWKKLEFAVDYMGLEFDGTAHTAAADAGMTAQLVKAMAARQTKMEHYQQR